MPGESIRADHISFFDWTPGYLDSFDRMDFQQTGKQGNAGRFERVCLNVTTKNLTDWDLPDAKSRRKTNEWRCSEDKGRREIEGATAERTSAKPKTGTFFAEARRSSDDKSIEKEACLRFGCAVRCRFRGPNRRQNVFSA